MLHQYPKLYYYSYDKNCLFLFYFDAIRDPEAVKKTQQTLDVKSSAGIP